MPKTAEHRQVQAMRGTLSEVLSMVKSEDLAVEAVEKKILKVLEGLADLELFFKRNLLRSPPQDRGLVSLQRLLTANRRATNAEAIQWTLNEFTEYDADHADMNADMVSQPTFTKEGSVESVSMVASFSEGYDVHLSSRAMQIIEEYPKPSFRFFDLPKHLLADQRQIPSFAFYAINNFTGGLDAVGRWINDLPEFHKKYFTFLHEIDKKYLKVMYHNASHAVDVMATTDRLMMTSFMQSQTTILDRLIALTTAACHDVAHEGRDARFHLIQETPLALQYHDKSVLENMHASVTFTLMNERPDCNWLQHLIEGTGESDGVYRMRNKMQQYVRSTMLKMILGTDNARHEKFMQQLIQFVEAEVPLPEASDGESQASPEELRRGSHVTSQAPPEELSKHKALDRKQFLMKTVLHAADLSGPTKPQDIMMLTTKRVLAEFWDQGDEEKRLGLPIGPLSDRQKGMKTVPGTQIFFFAEIVQPLYKQLSTLMTEVGSWELQLQDNIQFWRKKKEEEATFEQLYGAAP